MEFRLTQYSHGAGCGCKISPQILDKILHSALPQPQFPNLLVGNAARDDAAVYDMGNGMGIVSTTDFFMPICDDAFDFGRIASVNAISDVYAMGGKPLMAIAILGWPVDKLPAELAAKVLEGSREACANAGIPLAGGHSIDCPEPIFGLAVTGTVPLAHVKQNTGGKVGDLLFLTKPLGVGILTTAQKKGILKPEHSTIARDSMVRLNVIGEALGSQPYVSTMTDVTGFGLLGHLSEVCEASGVSAEIRFADVPRIPAIDEYMAQKAIPGGTNRNFASYGHKVSALSDEQKAILCDPQTSGGLLVCVRPAQAAEFLRLAADYQVSVQAFGELVPRQEPLIAVLP